MQNPKVCRTLLDILEAEKRWAERQQLQGLTPEEQLIKLETLLKAAVSAHDDGYASLVVKWAPQLFEDIHLQPLVGPHGQAPVGLKAVEATENARAAAAGWAWRIWRGLPVFEDGEQVIRTGMDGGMMRPAMLPVLTETKKALLTVIVTRWRQTKDEAEADRLFDFLRRLESPIFEDIKMFESALRLGTDKGFPPPRAMRHYLLIEGRAPQELTDAEEILLRLLPLSWSRNSGPHEKGRVFGAGLLVLSCSSGAFDRLQQVAKALGAVDERMRSLEDFLRQPSPYTTGFKTEISYGADNLPILTIRYGSNCFLAYLKEGNRMRFSVAKAQERFREFRYKVEEWREHNGALKFLLVMEVAGNEGSKPNFRDEHVYN